MKKIAMMLAWMLLPVSMSFAQERTVTLEDALSATPPERVQLGKKFAHEDSMLAAIDQWIADTSVDAPNNLRMRDILLAMPISVSGPRLVELAKKAKEPQIQASWKRHLESYPGPYANVLAAWTMAAADDPEHFLALLKLYAELQPDKALDLWARLIENNELSSLKRVADYGLSVKDASSRLEKRLASTELSEVQRLRLYRALTKSIAVQGFPEAHAVDEVIVQDLTVLLAHKLVSRRIVALDVIGSLRLSEFESQASTVLSEAKNSTERAHALSACVNVGGAKYSELLKRAIETGDEIERMNAANLLVQFDEVARGIDIVSLKTAFSKEIWPETQRSLYRVIKARDASFAKKVMLDPALIASTRMAAVEDLTAEDASSLTMSDLATLQREGAPIELIATTAESIYAYHPENREKLQTWISVQRPFERRLLLSFARFVQTDKKASNEVQPYVREICKHAVEEENILQPCIAYFEDLTSSDDDKALLKQLEGRRKQFDMMMDL